MQTNVTLCYLKAAADEVRKINGGHEIIDDEIVSTTIATGGTLQRRGFSSKNNVVTIIANTTGKGIDERVKTKECKACTYWKGKTSPSADKFQKIHKCLLNHTASSGSMESDGVLECFI